MDNFRESILHAAPFLSLLSTDAPANRPLLTRLSEQTIVGIVAAFVALQVMQARQAEQIDGLRKLLQDHKAQTTDERRELREQIERIRADLYTPKR